MPQSLESSLVPLEGLLREDRINEFYLKVDEIIEKALISADDVQIDPQDFQRLLNIRILTPILALYISRTHGIEIEEVRRIALKSALQGEGLSALGDVIRAEPTQDARDLYRAIRSAAQGQSAQLPPERAIRISIVDVGAKQRTIKRIGGFKEMRGASLLIDALPRVISGVVERTLGYEFVLSKEAGELVFLSTAELNDRISDELMKAIEEIPFGETLQLKTNFDTGPDLLIEDLLLRAGSSYVLSLANCRHLKPSGDDSQLVEPHELCRSCRNEIAMPEGELRSVLSGLSGDVERLMNLLRRDLESEEVRICKKCLAQWTFGQALVEILSGRSDWMDDVVTVVEESNVFKVLQEIKEFGERMGMKPSFVTNLDDYNYAEGSNALVAMVSADGDRFGRLKSGARSLTQFYALSVLFMTLMKEGFISGAKKALEFEQHLQGCLVPPETSGWEVEVSIPVTPLFIAGDDMVFVIRAEHLKCFLEGFHARARQIASRARELGIIRPEDSIGVSMGASVARTKVPGLFMYDSSHDVQRALKNVLREYGDKNWTFATHLHLAYFKSSASWQMVRKLDLMEGVDPSQAGKVRNWLIWLADDDRSPVLKALDRAVEVQAGREVVRGADLKGVMEDLLSGKVYPQLALLRWMSDISRALKEEEPTEEGITKAERMKNMVFTLYRGENLPMERSWLPLYLISAILDMVEDRAGRTVEPNRSRQDEDVLECVWEGFTGC